MAVNWGNGISGAASGASIGSMGGGYGAIAGGVIGGAIGLFSGGKKKKKKGLKQISTLDPQQQQLYADYIDALRGEGANKDLFNFNEQGYNEVFDKTIGRHAYRNFNENIIPGITGQFRGNNIMNSSYTGESLSRAGRDVQESLDALRSQNVFQGQENAKQNKISGMNNILNLKTFDYERPQEGAPGGIDSILGQLAPFAGQYLAGQMQSSMTPTPGQMQNRQANSVVNASR